MPKTRRITTEVKKRFVENLKKHGDNRTVAYLETMKRDKPLSRDYAQQAGSRLFQDPEVQEIYKEAGVDIKFVAKKNKELMTSGDLQVEASLVRQFNAAVLKQKPSDAGTPKLNINLFGDLNNEQVERIRGGRKAIITDPGTGESQPE